ncbi:MAG: DUF2125 domain-containing protein [Pseudomonadota bacterium]
MRFLFAALIALSVAWSAYWWFGSSREADQIAAWLSETDRLDATAQTIQGFPNRFDTTLENVVVNLGTVTWRLDWLQLFRLSYRPGHYIASFAPEQNVDVQGSVWRLRTQDSRASVIFAEAAFDNSSAVFSELSLTAPDRTNFSAEEMLFATRRVPAGYEVALRLTGFGVGDRVADINLDGIVSVEEGIVVGTLMIGTTDSDVLGEIGATLGVTGLQPGATLDMTSEGVSLNGALIAPPFIVP